MIRVTFLGTSAARPTVGRGVSALALQREGEVMLFDCGEGTQRQMMRYQTGFGISAIFVTHMHADHFLGITGLVRTLALQGREEPLELYGPPGCEEIITQAVLLGVDRVRFRIDVQELKPGARVERDEYDIWAYPTRHGASSVGYLLREHDRLGRFDVERARSLGIPEGPLFGKLHKGESVEVDGRIIRPQELVGPARPGRSVVYTGDTLPCDETVAAASGADLLVHEATFSRDEAERAHSTFHSTAHDAAEIALRAGAERLVLTHISARYADNPAPLEQEARTVFRGARVAFDGMALELPYRESGEDSHVESGPVSETKT
jgi:ribonuclease Z